ncbi:hypothetical protein FRB98_001440 [Tulasnella sp. 332]|nr:hypothetical protein FRB98_001440 [Tulasnella sp. 332]
MDKLTRLLTVLPGTLRMFPLVPKYATEDASFSAQAAFSESEAADVDVIGGKENLRRNFIISEGSEVFFDLLAVNYDPLSVHTPDDMVSAHTTRYWPDHYALKPDRFVDPD